MLWYHCKHVDPGSRQWFSTGTVIIQVLLVYTNAKFDLNYHLCLKNDIIMLSVSGHGLVFGKWEYKFYVIATTIHVLFLRKIIFIVSITRAPTQEFELMSS